MPQDKVVAESQKAEHRQVLKSILGQLLKQIIVMKMTIKLQLRQHLARSLLKSGLPTNIPSLVTTDILAWGITMKRISTPTPNANLNWWSRLANILHHAGKQNNKHSHSNHGSQSSSRDTKPTVVIGDSIVKGLYQERLSRSSHQSPSKKLLRDRNWRYVRLRKAYNEEETKEGYHSHRYYDDTWCRQPSEIMQDLVELHHQIKESSPETKRRSSNSKSKHLEVNKLLKVYCNKNKINLMNHDNIDSKSLNGSRLHLNQLGTSLFAKNITIYLKGF